ncbi:MAG: hypothetical protein WCC64_11245 [Aliidongia sp.]
MPDEPLIRPPPQARRMPHIQIPNLTMLEQETRPKPRKFTGPGWPAPVT